MELCGTFHVTPEQGEGGDLLSLIVLVPVPIPVSVPVPLRLNITMIPHVFGSKKEGTDETDGEFYGIIKTFIHYMMEWGLQINLAINVEFYAGWLFKGGSTLHNEPAGNLPCRCVRLSFARKNPTA